MSVNQSLSGNPLNGFPLFALGGQIWGLIGDFEALTGRFGSRSRESRVGALGLAYTWEKLTDAVSVRAALA